MNSIFYDQLRGPYQIRRASLNCKPTAPKRLHLDISFDNDLAVSALQSVVRAPQELLQEDLKPIKSPIMKSSRNRSIMYSKQLMKKEDIIIGENSKDQADAVMQHLLKIPFCKNETEILAKWIYTLPQETRMEIEVDKKYFPIPRNIDQKSITKGLNQLYGTGHNRRLRPGEEASIMETIRRYLENVNSNPQLLTHSVSFTLHTILRLASLEELSEFPFCMKQLDCHWKLMATRFKHNGQNKSRKLQHAIQIAIQRGHFLDVKNNQKSILVQYLLKYAL